MASFEAVADGTTPAEDAQVDEQEIREVVELAKTQGHRRADIRAAASEVFLALSDNEQARRSLFALGATALLLRWSSDPDDDVAVRCLSTLVNLGADLFEERIEAMLELRAIDRIESLVHAADCSAGKRDVALSLLANLTSTVEGTRQAMRLDDPDPLVRGQRVRKLVDRLVASARPAAAEVDDWQHVASLVCNVSQLQDGRDLLRRRSTQLVVRLLPQLASPNPVRRRGIAAAVRNCCFEVGDHEWLLHEVRVDNHLLLPLAGPEPLTAAERDGMDPWLRERLDAAGPGKEREPDAEVRRSLLGALQLLCTEKASRQFLRKRRAYPLIRNYDQSETDEANSEIAFNVVNFLVRDEEQGDNEGLVGAAEPTDGGTAAGTTDLPVRHEFKSANAHHKRPATDVDIEAQEETSEIFSVD